jgi:hypothetical protein
VKLPIKVNLVDLAGVISHLWLSLPLNGPILPRFLPKLVDKIHLGNGESAVARSGRVHKGTLPGESIIRQFATEKGASPPTLTYS